MIYKYISNLNCGTDCERSLPDMCRSHPARGQRCSTTRDFVTAIRVWKPVIQQTLMKSENKQNDEQLKEGHHHLYR
jgi:hypothetical protein